MKRKMSQCGFLAVALCFLLSGFAAAVQISTLPPPPPSAKLRVFLVVMTTEHKSVGRPIAWHVSPEKLEQEMKRGINAKLREMGFYEVVNEADVQTVLKGQTVPGWQWKKGDCRLAVDVGHAVHADYVMVFERTWGVNLQYDARLINLRTGKPFVTSGYVLSSMPWYRNMTREQQMHAGKEAIGILIRSLFQEAKSDLMQTAILKGKKIMEETPPVPAKQQLPEKPEPGTIDKSVKKTKPDDKIATVPGPAEPPALTAVARDKPAVAQPRPLPALDAVSSPVQADSSDRRAKDDAAKKLVFEKELEKALSTRNRDSQGPRLVVYDFDAAERMKVVGLILTEALREELHHLGGFILVNRESMLKIMDEYKLQQTALVDEKQVVAVGKWLAANEAITGQLGALGNTSILQVKRVDITTMGTLSLGSLKCPAGQEDELLDQMPELARKLASPK